MFIYSGKKIILNIYQVIFESLDLKELIYDG